MPKSASQGKSRSRSKKTAAKSPASGKTTQPKVKDATPLNPLIKSEITRLVQEAKVQEALLETFAIFVIENHQKSNVLRGLSLTELKKAVYQRFSVKSTPELRKSGAFKMATDGMESLNFSLKETWEVLYRKFIGILPGEDNQTGYACINGINIFDYFMPWQVFDLDPKVATPEEIRSAYHNLSKIYHPDIPKTGDAKIFDRLTIMYKSLTAGA